MNRIDLQRFLKKLIFVREKSSSFTHYAFLESVGEENVVLKTAKDKLLCLSFEEILSCRELSFGEREKFMAIRHNVERKKW